MSRRDELRSTPPWHMNNTSTGDHAHDLAQLATERKRLEHLIGARVEQARSSGMTWQKIGDALGTTKQAAYERYRKTIDAVETNPTDPIGTAPAWIWDPNARSWVEGNDQ